LRNIMALTLEVLCTYLWRKFPLSNQSGNAFSQTIYRPVLLALRHRLVTVSIALVLFAGLSSGRVAKSSCLRSTRVMSCTCQ
jgi:hypothetical protein